LGVGDDAAVIDPKDEVVVVTTDLLTEGVHFDLSYTPLKHLGYKAVVVNLSDVYAMNATPKQITVALAISNRFSVEAVEELYIGIRKACEVYNVDLVGGDTTSSKSGLTLSITAIGTAKPEKIVKRSTAQDNDLIVVSGDLGGAYMGLQVLEREKTVFASAPTTQPELEGFDYILERQLKPEARRDIIELLAKIEVQPTSMIDISDGLASEILHLCTESNLGCRLHENKIPIDQQTFDTALDFNLDPTLCALSGGEDYELLFTVKQADFDKIKGDPHFAIIGHMSEVSDGTQMVLKNGGEVAIQAQGWDALLGNEEAPEA
jgi:thiamine-monophosphate kinase